MCIIEALFILVLLSVFRRGLSITQRFGLVEVVLGAAGIQQHARSFAFTLRELLKASRRLQ